jgi:DNA invertase Pin-like site-specific DNA recombinase
MSSVTVGRSGTMGAIATKITAQHQEKRAYVYIRQSDPRQVRLNRGSQYNQYALVEHAVSLGWIPQRVHVIDEDLGHSSQEPDRHGFAELVSEVSLGRVGLVLAYEASRLARSNADWYRLLDLAALVGTLIGDADGLYDPREYNDRLLLGLRGMLSEAELHLLRLRLKEGRLRRVERGEYRHHVPTGLTRLPDGRVVKDPDQAVQHTIALVFERFAMLGSVPKVLRRLRAEAILLPRFQTSGFQAGQLLWKRPSESAISDILTNPAYAGTFVYGRRPLLPGTHRQGRRKMEDWPTVRPGMYPAYISWDQYLANQDRLQQNSFRYRQHRRGAVREGNALLAGLVVCGRCGRHMRVAYKATTRYFCEAMARTYAAPTCQHLVATEIEAAVVAAFFEAIQPAELDLLEEVLASQQADHDRLARQYAAQVQRATYEVRLAQKQYDAVDPENRLVAAELERRWEQALRALAQAQEQAERFAQQPRAPGLDPALRTQLAELSTRLPELWESGRLRVSHQKELLRSLIRQVILNRVRPDTIEVRIVWLSGAVSTLEVHPFIHRSCDVEGYAQLVERVLDLSAQGYTDAQIAVQLSREGFRSARRRDISAAVVVAVRARAGETSILKRLSKQEKIEGLWTVRGLARELGVDRDWVYNRIASGTIPAAHYRLSHYYVIEDAPPLLARLRALVSTQHPS